MTYEGARRLVEAHGLGTKLEVPTDRREALDGADFVICTFQVGGIEAYGYDVNVPREFGVDQPVGDTPGPGGVFRGLRSVTALKEIATDMKLFCPSALLIQYANPMSINCWASSELGIKTVGLCHSVQHTSKMLARELNVPYEEVTFDSAGVNHTAWFTTFRRGDEDLVPRIRQVMTERHLQASAAGIASDELYAGGNEHGPDRADGPHRLLPHRVEPPRERVLVLVPQKPGFGQTKLAKALGLLRICSAHSPDHNVDEFVETSRREGLAPSQEYGAYIIDSMTTGTRRVIYGNVPNDGLVSNLPSDCCVEVACLVSDLGLLLLRYGSLPAACAALNNVQVNVQRLAVRAALDCDRSLVYAAVALDPLTGALLTVSQIREMVDRLFEAERPWLGAIA